MLERNADYTWSRVPCSPGCELLARSKMVKITASMAVHVNMLANLNINR
jgi:hypothetical protein